VIDARHDARFMAAALAVGWRGQGRTAPNPSVGAVIVRPGPQRPVVVGAARSADGGRPHAEPLAIAQAGAAARGATAYVTLEPCSHVSRTPPCADVLVEAGVAGVVIAIEDCNPEVAGGGIARLRDAGIPVRIGVRPREAAYDLRGHVSRMMRGRPHVALKLALAADGAIGRTDAPPGAGALGISCPASRVRAHLLRANHDAIAVGVGTVIADDPRLTCRLPGMGDRSPQRVVFDTEARTAPGAALLREPAAAPALVLVGEGAPRARTAALTDAGAELITLPRAGSRLDLAAALGVLGARGITMLLVEGGARLAEALAAEALVDEAFVITSNRPLAAGAAAVRPFGGDAAGALSAQLALARRTLVGEDAWMHLMRACSPGS